jgi:ferrochelatase
MKKIAIVLLNLGAPDRLEAVEPFLFNLFNDPAISTIPQPLRTLFAWLIAKYRHAKAEEVYRQLGGGSPLYENTKKQANALEQALIDHHPGEHYKVFITMRYWHPFIEETLKEINSYEPEEIFLVPLYPQFSSATTASSFKQWEKVSFPIRRICCYFNAPFFIQAWASIFLEQTASLDLTQARILFSAHGLPEKTIRSGDPYQWQIEQSAQALITELSSHFSFPLDWRVCYQSRVGPLKWIGPSTEHEIAQAVQDQKGIVLVPLSFVSEHSETLIELDKEYKVKADQMGALFYKRLPTPSTHPLFIKNLVDLIDQMRKFKVTSCSYTMTFCCPKHCSHCPKNQF